MSWTGEFWNTEEEAIKQAKEFSAVYKQYHTVVKGEPFYKDRPEKCYAISDRYDPDVIARDNYLKELARRAVELANV